MGGRTGTGPTGSSDPNYQQYIQAQGGSKGVQLPYNQWVQQNNPDATYNTTSPAGGAWAYPAITSSTPTTMSAPLPAPSGLNQQLAQLSVGAISPLTGLPISGGPLAQAALQSGAMTPQTQAFSTLAGGGLAPISQTDLSGGLLAQAAQQPTMAANPAIGQLSGLVGAAQQPIGAANPAIAQLYGLTGAAQGGDSQLAGLAQQGLTPFVTGGLGSSPATQAAIAAFQQNTLPVIQQQMALQGLGSSPALGQAVGQSLATAMPQFIQNDLQNRLAAVQGLQAQQGLGQAGVGLAGQLAQGAGGLGLQQAGLGQAGLGLAGQFAQGAGGLGLQQAGLSQAGLGLAGQLGGQAAQQRLAAAQGLGQLGQLQQAQQGLGQAGIGMAGQLQNQAIGQRLAAAQGLQAQQQLGQAGAGLAAQIANQEQVRALQAAGQAGNIFGGIGSQVYNPMAQLQQAQWQQGLQGFGSAGQLQRGITQEQIDAAQMDYLRRQGLAEQATTGIFGGSVLPPTFQQSTTSSGGGK